MSDKPTPAVLDDAIADLELRSLLAAYDEPALHSVPSTIADGLLASLPPVPPAQAAAQMQRAARMRLLRGTTLLLAVALLVTLGAWGVYTDTDAMVALFGGVGSTAGYLVLVVLLTLKPFAQLLAPGLPLLLLLAAMGGLWWLWQRLLQAAPPMLAVERVGVEP